MTDDGWFWDSDERFGWVTYHYGRWVNDRYYGWVWIPGTEWAPAWVSWRHGNGYTGWAPLPPRATWRTRIGLSIGGLDIDAFIGADDYGFVQDRYFMDRGVYQRFVPPTQNVTIINVTNNITNYTVVNDRIVDSGIPVANIERAVGRRVSRARTVDVNRADARSSARAGEVDVYRPQVRAVPGRRPTQGRSLVKGEAPPPLLVERRKQREQQRQSNGNQAEVTAQAVQKQRLSAQQQQEAQRLRAQAQQDAVTQRTKAQAQQKVDAQAQAAQRAKDAQLAREQKQADQQQANQQRAQAQAQQKADAQAQAAQRAKDNTTVKGKKKPKASQTNQPAGLQE